MLITYTVDRNGKNAPFEEYISFEESVKRYPDGKRGVYINLTNRCTCACTFCLRPKKQLMNDGTSNDLWLDHEPTVDEVKDALQKLPWNFISEVVFCGFGEPTMRLPDIIELLKFIKKNHPDVKTRINTNGLSDLFFKRDTAKDFENHLLDAISISLNASNAERYLELTRNPFGLQSFDALLTFAEHCKKYVDDVAVSIVDKVNSPEEIARCQKICDERHLRLRVRSYEEK